MNSNPVPDTLYGSFANDVYAPKDALTLSLLGRVAPASKAVPLGAIMFDGSINFAVHEQSSNIQLDAKGRIVGITSPSGKTTTLAYNNQDELIAVKQSDGQYLKKRKGLWFDGDGAESCWKEIVALQDGTLWCKKADGVIVNNHIDETVTLQNIRQRFILWFDSMQRLTAVRYPNGQSRFFA
jgi:YD repeat-containing protein